jgi:hypothetical protein
VTLTGAQAIEFTEGLSKTLVNQETWETVYCRRSPRELWILSYPDSGHHGGGVPRLDPLDVASAAQRLRHHAWTAEDPNALVEFLVDRWCERRALSPLRYILEAWPHLGMTDGFGLLREALAKVTSLSREALDEGEMELAHLAQSGIEKILDRR